MFCLIATSELININDKGCSLQVQNKVVNNEEGGKGEYITVFCYRYECNELY